MSGFEVPSPPPRWDGCPSPSPLMGCNRFPASSPVVVVVSMVELPPPHLWLRLWLWLKVRCNGHLRHQMKGLHCVRVHAQVLHACTCMLAFTRLLAHASIAWMHMLDCLFLTGTHPTGGRWEGTAQPAHP